MAPSSVGVVSAGAAAPPVGVPPFDQVSVAVLPGQDLVVRIPGVLLVVAVPAGPPAAAPPAAGLGGWGTTAEPAPALAAPAGDRRLGELVGLIRRVSAAGRRAPGRRLLDELRGWLASAPDVPSFAVAAATEEGLALALLGDGSAEVPDLGLRLTSGQGAPLDDGRAYLDRLVDWPPAVLRLSAGAAVDGGPHPLADLEAGSVPGAAAVLAPAAAVAAPAPPAPPAPPVPTGGSGTMMVDLPSLPLPPRVTNPPVPPPAPDADGHDHAGHDHAGHDHGHDHAGHGQAPVVPPPAAAPAAAVELPAPVRSVSFLKPPAADEAEPAREPLPVVTEEPTPEAPAAPTDDRPQVQGILCKNGHLNDPRVLFCAQCGIRTTQQTAVFVNGVRPPLGLLVFDTGATVSLDADYLLGREPETDDRVRTGERRGLPIVDQTGGVSRHHAEIRLENWDVLLTDIGSANGTLFARRGELAWTSLIPGQPVQLTPGMTVRMGSRQFAFESPHGGV